MTNKQHKHFQEIYKKLNSGQKQAVDTIEGPVMVVAGPGTGKTQVLAARIANILLKTDVEPYNILALTFTDSAAKNMRDRVVDMIGQPGYYVQISTFHAFCAEVIKSHPESFPIDRDSQALSDLERYDLVQSIILELSLDVLKPLNRPLFYIKEVMKSISDLKREGVGTKQYELMINQDFAEPQEDLTKTAKAKFYKTKEKNEELLKIYQEYQRRLRSNLRFDYDDMISLVVSAFQSDELLLLEYQERLQYILVDEYQDTNSAQNQVVLQLSSFWGSQANVFVVGDPHQSIYRFQGASVENVHSFLEQYPKLTLVTLEKGYRCPQTIYDAAHQLISHNELTHIKDAQRRKLGEALSNKLISVGNQGGQPQLYIAPSQQLELIQIAEHIQDLLINGTKPEEIAILYRTNAEAVEIQEILERWQIPYEIDGGKDILQTELIRQLLELFKVIDQIKDGQPAYELFEVMCYAWLNLPTNTVYKIARLAGQSKQDMYQVIKQLVANPKKQTEVNISPLELEPVVNFINKLESWSVLDAQLTFPEWIENVIQETKLLDWIRQQPNQIELMLNVNALFNEITQLAKSHRGLKLAEFLQIIGVMLDHSLSIFPEDLNVSEGAIQLATVHKAKGREWQHVFLVHCIDGRWGNRTNRQLLPLPPSLLKYTDTEQKERNEDERRLFYVAATRARKQLYCSYPETIVADNRSQDTVGSMFLVEIEEHLKKSKPSQSQVEQQQNYLEKLLSPNEGSLFHTTERDFFKQLVGRFRLSVSALNTYLKDPDQFVKNYLLRVPQAQPAYLAYGVAMHSALEYLFTYWQKKQRKVNLDDLQNHFQEQLGKQLLAEDEVARRLEKGKQALTAYYEEQFHPDRNDVLFIERFFGSGFAKAMLGDIALAGRIDRVDWIDKGNKTARVIDYKTGKPRSVNEIEGKTLASALSEREQALPEPIRGPYKRQLLFYKLLAELDQSFVPQVTEAVFDFVEPKENGKFVQRSFTLQDNEVEMLKDLIKEVMSEIRALTFLD